VRVAPENGSANASRDVPGARRRGFRFRSAGLRGPRAGGLFLELRDEGAEGLELDLVQSRYVFTVAVGEQRLSALDELDVFHGRRELNFVAQWNVHTRWRGRLRGLVDPRRRG
jgi:hypothetical protein